MALAILVAAILLVGCELQALPPGGQTPSVEPSQPTAPPTLTSTLTSTPPAQMESPTTTFTPGPPTATETASPTPDPYATYIIQQNDTLLYIIQQPPFNYRDLSVVDEILRLNPSIRSADRLPGPGSSIIIPYPTITPTIEGMELTASAQPAGPPVQLPGNAEIIQVAVAEGETILGIAERNSTTLVIVATLNPQLGFFNCDFTNPSGGPDCTVSLQVGQMISVPALTPTPTLSPTFSGNETATPTPTYAPPVAFYPQQNAIAPAIVFPLQWASAGILQDGEVYLVEVHDETAGTQHLDVTDDTSYRLPDSLVPSDGQTHTIRWRVSVATRNEQGSYRIISGEGAWRAFQWQSR
jgi:hypothetical protein